MKMGKMAWEVATLAIIAVMVMNWSVRQGAEAQVVTCLHTDGWGAPLADANSLVQYWRQSTFSFCVDATAQDGTCWAWNGRKFGWNALGFMCGVPPGICISSFDFGNYMNEILADCNQPSNVVQGHNHVISDFGDGYIDFYFSNADCLDTNVCLEEQYF